MKIAAPLQVISTITAAAAVCAALLLVAAQFIPTLGPWGLVALFAVPLVRNVAVVRYGRGADRFWGMLGAAIVVIVVGGALW